VGMRILSRRTFWLSAAILLLAVVACAWFIVLRSPITQENYDRIQDGMTEEQISAIFGGPADYVEAGPSVGRDARLCYWKSGGVDSIEVCFVEDKVVGKHFYAYSTWENLKWKADKIGIRWR
jgi:hypothetical protein